MRARTAWRRRRIWSGRSITRSISFSISERSDAMNQQEQYERFFQRHPHVRTPFFERPHWTRRRFFQLAAGGVSGAYLSQGSALAADGQGSGVTPKNTAKNVIF